MNKRIREIAYENRGSRLIRQVMLPWNDTRKCFYADCGEVAIFSIRSPETKAFMHVCEHHAHMKAIYYGSPEQYQKYIVED